MISFSIGIHLMNKTFENKVFLNFIKGIFIYSYQISASINLINKIQHHEFVKMYERKFSLKS